MSPRRLLTYYGIFLGVFTATSVVGALLYHTYDGNYYLVGSLAVALFWLIETKK